MSTSGLSLLLSSLAVCTLLPECGGTSVGFTRWSLWSPWSPCSRTCGGGIATRTRACQPGWRQPASVCLGEIFQSRLCNEKRCPEGSADSADEQCSQYDGREVAGLRADSWFADKDHSHDRNPCELRCRFRGSGMSYGFGKMANGTRCSPEGVCFRGRCTQVGCDGILGSRTRADMCGVCGGRNLTCVQVQQMYSPAHGRIHDYTPITVIPAGATNVRIRERSKNFLALLEGVQNKSSRFRPHAAGELNLGGTTFTYGIEPDHSESFASKGPTKGPVTLMIFLTERGNGDVRYEYWMPNDLASYSPKKSDTLESSTPSAVRNDGRKITKDGFSPITKSAKTASSGRSARSHPDHVEAATPVVTSVATLAPLDDEPTVTNGRGLPLDNRIPLPPLREPEESTGKRRPFFLTKTTTSTPRREVSPQRSKKPKKPRKKPKRTGSGVCPRCHRVRDQLGHFCRSDLAAHVKVLSAERMERGEIRYDVAVLESFRNVFALQQREFLWSLNATCPCPRLAVGLEYVVTGRLEANYRRKESRLVTDPQSFVRRYSEKRGRQFRRLRRLRRRKCNRIL